MQLVARYTKSPAGDAPEQVLAAVQHHTGQVVYFAGENFDDAAKRVAEFYQPLMFSSTVDAFLTMMFDPAAVSTNSFTHNLSLPLTMEELLAAFGGGSYLEGAE